MNIFKAELDTIHQNGVIGPITQFDNATLELQILTGGQVGESWNSPEFELIAMKRDMNPVREVDQDKFTILSHEEHRVRIELKEQFLTCRGTVKMQLIVKDGSRTSTTIFRLSIGQSLDATIVESLKDIKVLDDLDEVVELVSTFEVTAKSNEATRQHNEKLREVAESNRQVEFDKAQSQRDTEFNEKLNEFQEQVGGLKGEKGEKGDKGDKGELGPQGPQGIQGERGPIGLTGSQGPIGPQGERGEKGIQGEQGIQGPIGPQGPQGIQGERGAKGDKGEKGDPGPQGLQGEKGDSGGVVPSDMVDYMGEQHESLKETNDANVEYLLREINTAHYEGTSITATDTYQKQVKSAILKGQTLINLSPFTRNNGVYKLNASTHTTSHVLPMKLQQNKRYIFIFKLTNSQSSENSNYIMCRGLLTNGSFKEFGRKIQTFPNGRHWFMLSSNEGDIDSILVGSNFDVTLSDTLILEYQDGMENWDIPYFEGMQSVRMPFLKMTGKNLFDFKRFKEEKNRINTGGAYSSFELKLEANTQYSFNRFTKDGYGSNCYFAFNTVQGSYTGNLAWLVHSDNQNINCQQGKFITDSTGIVYISGIFTNENLNKTFELIQNLILIEGSTIPTSYEPYQSNILSCLEPVTLGKVGDVEDTLNVMTGEVVISTHDYTLTGDEDWRGGRVSDTVSGAGYRGHVYLSTLGIPSYSKTTFVSDKFKNNDWGNGVFLHPQQLIYFTVPDEVEVINSNSQLKDFIKRNSGTIKYPLAEKSIKTVDLKGQKVYSYDGTTHYICSAAEGSLVPTLSIDVPTNLPALVSRQRVTIENQKKQIITLEQENEQLIAQNEVQDTDIALNQDAINFMLFAPSVKSISEDKGGVSTMAAYLANQILKGRLDYTLVISRYGEFKEDIDTILIAEGKQDLIK